MDDMLIKQEIMSLDDRELVQLFNFTIFTSLGNLGVTEDEFREKLDMKDLTKIEILGYYGTSTKKNTIRNSTIHDLAQVVASDIVVLRHILNPNLNSVCLNTRNARLELINSIKNQYFKTSNDEFSYNYENVFKFISDIVKRGQISLFDLVGLCLDGSTNKKVRKQIYDEIRVHELRTNSKNEEQIIHDLTKIIMGSIKMRYFDGVGKVRYSPEKALFKVYKGENVIPVMFNTQNSLEFKIEYLLNNLIEYYLEKSATSTKFFDSIEAYGIDVKEEFQRKFFAYIVTPKKQYQLSPIGEDIEIKNNELVKAIAESYITNKLNLSEFLENSGTSIDIIKKHMLSNGMSEREIYKCFQNMNPPTTIDGLKNEYKVFFYVVDYYIKHSKTVSEFRNSMEVFNISSNVLIEELNKMRYVRVLPTSFEESLSNFLYRKIKSPSSNELIRKIMITNTMKSSELIDLIAKFKRRSIVKLGANELTIEGTINYLNQNQLQIEEKDLNSFCLELVKFYIKKANDEDQKMYDYFEKYQIGRWQLFGIIFESIVNEKDKKQYKLGSSESLNEFMGFGSQLVKPIELIDFQYSAYSSILNGILLGNGDNSKNFLYGNLDDPRLIEIFESNIGCLSFGAIKDYINSFPSSEKRSYDAVITLMNKYDSKTKIIQELDDFCVLNHLKTYQDDSNYNLDSYYTPSIKNAYMLYRFAQFKEKIVPRNHRTEENVFDLSNTSAIDCLNSININVIFKKGSADSLIENSSVEIIMKNYDAITHNINLEELDYKLKVITIVRNQIAHAHTKNDYNNGIISFEEKGIEYEVDVQKLYYLVNEYNKISQQEKEKSKVA